MHSPQKIHRSSNKKLTKKTVIRRIASPFKMTLIQIEFDNKNDIFFPGQTVSGNVFIQSSCILSARSVNVILNGKAKTDWVESEKIIVPTSPEFPVNRHANFQNYNANATKPVNLARNGSNVKKTSHSCQLEQNFISESVPYWSEITYTNQEQCIWSSTSEQENLSSGDTYLPFSFQLPSNLPPSFEGTHGEISYSLKVVIQREHPFKNEECEMGFSVIPRFDLNKVKSLEDLNKFDVKEASNNLGHIFKHGLLNIKVMVPKIGYFPGEQMDLTVFIGNNSSRDVHKVKFELQQIETYKAGRHHHNHFGSHVSTHKETETKKSVKNVIESVEEFVVKKHSIGKYQKSVKIPEIAPSFISCPIISVGYVLNVSVIAKCKTNKTVSCQLPIFIGASQNIEILSKVDKGYGHPKVFESVDFIGMTEKFEFIDINENVVELGQEQESNVLVCEQLTYGENVIIGKNETVKA